MDVRGSKNFTCVHLCIYFNFALVPLSNCVQFKNLYLRHILVDCTNISSASGWYFQLFIHTSVQFTIAVLNWNDLVAYAILLPMSFLLMYFDLGVLV